MDPGNHLVAAVSRVSAPALFRDALGKSPARIGFGLVVEYLMFFSAVFLALMLFATRVPMRLIDRVFGLRLRERFVDFLARVSPG